MFGLFKKKENKPVAVTNEKNPFLFLGQVVDRTILGDIYFRLHKNAKPNPEYVQQFVSATLFFDMDVHKEHFLKNIKPEYEAFLNQQDDLGHFWHFYNLIKKYSQGEPNPDIAIRNLSVYFLEHCCGIPKPYSMLHPNLIMQANGIITGVWKYLSDELNSHWFQKEVFIDDKIEIG
jgi:hypothetical protein